MKAQEDPEIGLLLSNKLGSRPYSLKWIRERRNLVTHRTERALVGVTTSQPTPSTNYFLVLAITGTKQAKPEGFILHDLKTSDLEEANKNYEDFDASASQKSVPTPWWAQKPE